MVVAGSGKSLVGPTISWALERTSGTQDLSRNDLEPGWRVTEARSEVTKKRSHMSLNEREPFAAREGVPKVESHHEPFVCH
jgi:hypothetical protein